MSEKMERFDLEACLPGSGNDVCEATLRRAKAVLAGEARPVQRVGTVVTPDVARLAPRSPTRVVAKPECSYCKARGFRYVGHTVEVCRKKAAAASPAAAAPSPPPAPVGDRPAAKRWSTRRRAQRSVVSGWNKLASRPSSAAVHGRLIKFSRACEIGSNSTMPSSVKPARLSHQAWRRYWPGPAYFVAQARLPTIWAMSRQVASCLACPRLFAKTQP